MGDGVIVSTQYYSLLFESPDFSDGAWALFPSLRPSRSGALGYLLLLELPVLPPALLGRARGLLPLDLAHDGGAALVAVAHPVELRRQQVSGDLAVLLPRACGLGLDDHAGGEVFELYGGASLILRTGSGG